jgi:hypothetical protein
MTEQNAEGVVDTLYVNAVLHRKQLIKNLASELRTIANACNKTAADAMAVIDKTDAVIPRIDSTVSKVQTVTDIYAVLGENAVTIKNIENLTHGQVGKPIAKGPSNVTQLPKPVQRNTATLATRSQASTGTVERTDNPGRERQRRRKESSNDQ